MFKYSVKIFQRKKENKKWSVKKKGIEQNALAHTVVQRAGYAANASAFTAREAKSPDVFSPLRLNPHTTAALRL